MKGFIVSFKIPLAIGIGFVLFGLIVAGSSSPQPVEQTQQISISPAPSEQKIQEEPQEVASVQKAQQQNTALVTFVIDGDTVELASGERVRLIGIDAPERGSQYYQESREKLEELVLNKKVRMEKDISEMDRYGRLLRYVYVGDVFANLEMVKSGYATAYTYPPDVTHSAEFVQTERDARNKQIGLWAPIKQEFIPPPSASSANFSLPSCASSDCDCSHFSSHAYAQWFHDNHDLSDRHRLDSDKDGLACESLP